MKSDRRRIRCLGGVVFQGRFQRLVKEDPDRESEAWPDLLLIDGGAGQVSAVNGILEDLGVEDIALRNGLSVEETLFHGEIGLSSGSLGFALSDERVGGGERGRHPEVLRED